MVAQSSAFGQMIIGYIYNIIRTATVKTNDGHYNSHR